MVLTGEVPQDIRRNLTRGPNADWEVIVAGLTILLLIKLRV